MNRSKAYSRRAVGHWQWGWLSAASLSIVVLCLALVLTPLQASAKPLSQAYDITRQCFAVSEERELAGGKQDSWDTLVRLDRTNSQTFVIGETKTQGIEAIAMGADGLLYAADANRFGTLDLATGQFTPKSQPFGTATGSIGSIALSDVDGLFHDNTNQTWYATLRRGNNDLLFQVDPTTGSHIANAFGPGKGYVEVPTVLDSNNQRLSDVDDIAVDPQSGVMYAAMNQGGAGGALVSIDKATGATSKIGEFHYPNPYPANPALAGQVVDDIEGLSFFNDGQLYGSTGDNGPDGNDKNKLFRIDKSNALATYIGDFPAGLVDYEGLACQTAQGFIKLQKLTNGPGQSPQDADTPSGPSIRVGEAVTWTYRIVNTGVLTLTDLVLTDDQLGLIGPGGVSNCPSAGLLLAPGQSLVCSAQGSAQAGQYANVGQVTAMTQEGLVAPRQTVSDSNPSYYIGVGAGITIKKFTNGQDADTPSGPQVLEGSPVTWTYLVTNTGDLPLSNVTVSDDQNVAVTCPKTTLLPQESMTCSATGTATVGQYVNIGRVVGTPAIGPVVQAQDLSHYLGVKLASVGDLVWNDSTANLVNGIQDANELGVPNITVKLYSAAGKLAGTKMTDADGRYRFNGILPGEYYMEFVITTDNTLKIVPQKVGDDRERDSDIDPITKRSEVFTLQAGEVDLSCDAGIMAVPDALDPGDEPTQPGKRIFLPLVQK